MESFSISKVKAGDRLLKAVSYPGLKGRDFSRAGPKTASKAPCPVLAIFSYRKGGKPQP
jgi:hypothetical protein